MTIEAQLADGRVLEFPDGTDPSVIQATVKRMVTPAPAPKAGFSLADTALGFGQGVIGAGKSLTDVFGADNAASEALGKGQKYLGEQMTPGRQAEIAARQEKIKAAEGTGFLNEVGAELGAIKDAPIQSTVQALGSVVPYVATSVVGAAAKFLPTTIRIINTIVGAAQGAGSVKGSIYDTVYTELVNKGMSEPKAKEQAALAQSYNSKNALDIAAGSALGAAGARFGVEEALVKDPAKTLSAKFLPRVGKAALAEAPMEGAQGAQEKMAQNRALQKEGFNTPTFQGVAGRAAGDAALGALAAGTVGATQGPKRVAPPPPEAPPEPVAPAKPTYEELQARLAVLQEQPNSKVRNRQMKALREQMAAIPAQGELPGTQEPQALPPETDLTGKPVLPKATQPTDVTPTPQELEAAGQQTMDLGDVPTSKPITEADLAGLGGATASISKANRQWLSDNVVGKTPEAVTTFAQQYPQLIPANRFVKTVLKNLAANAPTKFAPDFPSVEEQTAEAAKYAPETYPSEPQNESPTLPKVQPAAGARGRKPSVGVPVQPVVATGAAPTAGAPAEPSGQRLVPPQQPAGAGDVQQRSQLSPLADLPEAPAAPDAAIPQRTRKPKAAPVVTPPAPVVTPPAPVVTPPAPVVTPKPLPKPPEVTEATRATATAEVPQVVETAAAEGETAEERSKRELKLEADRQARSAAQKAQREAQREVTMDDTAKAVRDAPDEPLLPEHTEAVDEIDAKLNLYDTSEEIVKAQRAAAYIAGIAGNSLTPMAVRQYAQNIVDSQLDPVDVAAGRKKAGGKGVLYSTENADDRPLPEEVLDHIKRGLVTRALDTLTKSLEQGSVDAAVARRLSKLLGNTDIKIVDDLKGDEGQDVRGLSKSDGNLIQLDSKRGLNVETLLHESVHAASEHVLRQDPKSWTPQQAAAVDELNALWEAAKRDKSIELSQPAQKMLSEFITEAMTNKDLQVQLRAKPWKMKNAWDWFKRNMLAMIGVEHPKVMQDSVIAAMDTLFTAPPEYATSAAGMFDKAALDAVSTTGRKSRYKTIEMAIDDFLALADRKPPEATSTVKADGVRELMRSGTKFSSIPYLYVSADGETLKVVGHEGRNRAAALRAAGFETMPVELRGDDMYRWSEQADPDKFDYRETWPTRIEAQEDALNPKFSIPMPFTREQAPEDYVNPTEATVAMATAAKKAAPVAAPTPGTPGPTIAQRAKQLMPPPTGIKAAITSATNNALQAMGPMQGLDVVTKLRTQVVDKYAAVAQRLATLYDGAVRDAAGKVNATVIARQAEDAAKMLPLFFEEGGIRIGTAGLLETFKSKTAPAEVYTVLQKWAKQNGLDFETAYAQASIILEGMRLDALVKAKADVLIHWRTANKQIDTVRIAEAVAAYNASPELKEMSRIMDEPRIALVNQLEKSGRLTAEDAQFYRDALNYVPFDRMEDFDAKFTSRKRMTGRGVSQLGKLPELIGSEERPVGNVFDNYFKTMGWMVQQFAKQNANTELMLAMSSVGLAKPLGDTEKSPTGYSVMVYRDGFPKNFSVPTKYDQAAFADEPRIIPSYVRFMSRFSKTLRLLVTANPAFALSQVVQDVQGALLTSGVRDPFPFVMSVFGNFAKLSWHEIKGLSSDLTGQDSRMHDIEREFGRTGLAGAVDFTAPSPATNILYDLGLRKRSKLGALVNRLERITQASDIAVRKAVYDFTLEQSKSTAYPLGDRLLANTRARELINFHRRGTSGTMQDLIMTVPFLNATAQGMDLLYRAATGKDNASGLQQAEARKMFLKHVAVYAGAALAYAMAKAGDDEYEKLDRRTRDNNWILGDGVKIAIRGDVAVVKVAIENAIGYYRRQGTPEEQLASEMVLSTLQYAREQYVGRINIIPTAIRPVVENLFNYSTLTGRPLEGTYQQGLMPSERVSKGTSELAKAVAEYLAGNGVEISPIKIDNALKGYFGTSAASVIMLTDAMIHPEAIDRPMSKWMGLSGFMYDKSQLTNPKDEFYDLRAKVIPIQKTLTDIAATDVVKAEAFFQENQEKLVLAKTITHTLAQLAEVRKYRKWLNGTDAEATMTKEARTAEMDKLLAYETDMVSWVRSAKLEANRMFSKPAKP
jgi:hypothetical protein